MSDNTLIDSIPQGADVYLDYIIIGTTPFYYPKPSTQTGITFKKTNTADVYATTIAYISQETPDHYIIPIYNWSVPTFDFAIIPRDGEPYNGSVYIENTIEIYVTLPTLSGPYSGEPINTSCIGIPPNSTYSINPVQSILSYTTLIINTSSSTLQEIMY